MKRITRDHIHFFFDREIPPAIDVDPGERLSVETEDAIAGQLNPSNVHTTTHASLRANLPCSNPVTGPIHVRGAEPGDRLEVTIEHIELAPAERYAWTIFDPLEGLLTGSDTINRPLEEMKRILPIRDGALHFEFEACTIRVAPKSAVGTIGVAPAAERRFAFLNGNDFLGNIDIPALGPGTTVVLPVRVEGGRLSLGDVHAVSGHGEISGGAADCRALVDILVGLRKRGEGGYVALPQLNSPDFIGSIATAASLDQAVRMAYRDLLLRLEHDYPLKTVEAYQLLSSVGQIQIGQMLPPALHSVLAFIRRCHLP